MGLESATYISDLTATNPTSTDVRSQGDDHLRLLKSVLKTTFPNATKAFYFPDTASKSADFSVAATDLHKTFLVATTGGNVLMTLPTLASGDAGWFCFVMKTTTDTNAIFVTPPSGTIQSGALTGLAKTRRAISGVSSRIWWTGTAWIAERAEKSPVGAIIDYDGATLPVGYELPNGQTLTGIAGSVYPDFYAAKSSLVTRDITGRAVVMKEAVATRLTSAGGGVDGGTLGAVGGAETHTLSTAELPAHTHTITDPGHVHTFGGGVPRATAGSALSLGGTANSEAITQTASGSTGITGTNSAGGGGAHTIMQPTIVLNKILVVE